MSDSYKGFFVEWIEDWSQIFKRCNWYTLRAVEVSFENDRMMGGIEITVIFAGLGFRARWNHTETETVKSLKRDVDAIKAEFGA